VIFRLRLVRHGDRHHRGEGAVGTVVIALLLNGTVIFMAFAGFGGRIAASI
jgi:hypothetical protein